MKTTRARIRVLVTLVIIIICGGVFPLAAWSQGGYCFSGSDWNGDGQGDMAIWRPSNGLWAVLGLTRFYYGGGSGPGIYDVPVLWYSPFSYHASPGIFRSSSGAWHMKYDYDNTIYYGRNGDRPVPASYLGNTNSIAIFRDGLWAVRGVTRFYFGRSGDIPVPGLWQYGSGLAAIFRSGLWAIRGSTRFYFGRAGDIPVPGSYTGAFKYQAAVFRPSNGLWAIRGVTKFYFGKSGDWPMAANLGRTAFQSYDINDDPVIFRPSQGLWSIKGVFYTGGNRKWFGTSSDIPVAGPQR